MKKSILFILVCALFTLTVPSYASSLEQEEPPLFVAEDLQYVLEHLGFDLDIEPEAIIETDIYIHLISETAHCTVISHKVDEHKFLGLRDNAWFTIHIGNNWIVYRVPLENKDSAITQLWRLMMLDFYKHAQDGEEPQEYIQTF